jgi:hypothetical protein
VPNETPYQLVWSSKAQHSLEELRSREIESGRASELDALVIAINARLRTTPLSLGNIYRSTGAIDERKASQGFLGIDFAVDVQRQFVLVRDCWRFAESEGNGPRSDG